jgi:hypothetical protein
MKATVFTTSILALALATTAGAASAQSAYGYPDGPPVAGQDAYGSGYYDYGRVIRVAPVIGARNGYPAAGQRCTTRNDGYADGYGDDGYGSDDGYPDQDGDYRSEPQRGSNGGRTMATVVGSVLGAVIGSQVGGGSARYATSAIGTAVGGLAGQQVYDQAHREPQRASVTVCDPVEVGYGGNRNLFDVTYEYAGRTYTTRTTYNPGERIRVRVDVRAE